MKFTQSKITKITPIGKKPVFDIQVDKDSSYLAQGFVNHNSCKEPNMQQVPPDLRSMIIARPGKKIISLDYSQFEMRAAAAATEEEYLVEAFVHRAEMLSDIKKLASSNGYIDPDSFVKAVTKQAVTLKKKEYDLVHEFALTDIHRRNAALIFNLDVSDVDAKQRSVGKCVSLDTYVHTDKGIAKLRDFLPKRLKEDTYYPLSNVKVLTDEGYRDSPTLYYSGVKEVLSLKTASGIELQCTPQHRFRALRKGKYVWIKAKDLKPGDTLFVKHTPSTEGSLKSVFKFKKNEFESLGTFIGLYIKYGYIEDNKLYFDGSIEELVKDTIFSIFGKVKYKSPNKKEPNLEVQDESIVNWLKEHLPNKILPKEILDTLDFTLISSILKSCHQVSNNMILFASPNINLLNQIRNILYRFGIQGHLKEARLGTFGVPFVILHAGATTQYLRTICKQDFKGLYYPEKTYSCNYLRDKVAGEEELTEADLELQKFLFSNLLVGDQLVSITKGGKVQVGDFSVPDNSTVVYEGLVSHNTLGYAVLYGAGPPRVQESLSKEGFYYTLDECAKFLDQFFGRLPKVKRYIEDVHQKVLKEKCISTYMGRKRFFELPSKYNPKRYEMAKEAAFREALNYGFQGANADATKLSMVLIGEAFRKFNESERPLLLLSVHDEIVAELFEHTIKEVAEVSEDIMVDCGMKSLNYKAPVEVSISIGDAWSK